jgi:hypothetical protein
MTPWDSVVRTGQTNIAAITSTGGLTATMNVESGTGGPLGSGCNSNNSIFQAVGQAGIGWTNMGATDNGGLSRPVQSTAPGTPATIDLLAVQSAPNASPFPISLTVSHAATTALAASLSVKTTAGALFGFNCTAITGGAAGFCVVVNSATTPTAGAAITPLDFCSFDTTARGCSLGRSPSQVAYSAGIQILVTSAASPYTFTTGVDTAAITGDFQ